MTTFTAVDGGGTGTAQSAVTHTGFYGYSEFKDGVNEDIDPNDYELINTGDSRIIYLPDNIRSTAWDMKAGGANETDIPTTAKSVSSTSGNYTWTIKRICSAKYSPVQMVFINKNGIHQDFYFFLKAIENVTVKSENYKRNIFKQSTSNYNTKEHQIQTFNKNGKKRFTLNTEYVIEQYNEVIEDILLSEYVWIIWNGVVRPVTVKTSSLLKKTSLNDRLIQYTLEVEDANDIINNIV
ncbi:MAG: hypothetical protein CMJ25_18490 [Phycisphaerae bacterium]|nr:hypothetical protein [Phycisphaerae bacterium]